MPRRWIIRDARQWGILPSFDLTVAACYESQASLSESFTGNRPEGGTAKMSPTQWVLDLIVCPQCRAKVQLKADGSGLQLRPAAGGVPDTRWRTS